MDRANLVYRTNKYTYSFKRDIYNNKVFLKEAAEDQSSSLVEIEFHHQLKVEKYFQKNTRKPAKSRKKSEKRYS